MRISIGIRDFPTIDRVLDLAIDDSFIGMFCYERAGLANHGTLDDVVRNTKSGIIRRFVFDTDRLKQTAANHYAIHDSEIKQLGKVSEVVFRDHCEYIIVMKRRGDFETLVHELMHISNKLYNEGDSYQRDFSEEDMYEDAINIASKIVIQRFPKLLNDVQNLQINRVMDLMEKHGLDSPEKFFQLEEFYDLYGEELDYDRRATYKMILGTYFRDEVLSAFQNGRPKLPSRQLWLF